jgi:large subunit ribosomal protein L9
MKVILLKEVKGLGKRGTVVQVADGYGRNYLLPKGFALVETPGNRKRVEEEERIKSARKEKDKKDAEKLKVALENISLTTAVQVGEGDRLFGTVTPEDVASLLEKEGISIEKRKIHIPEPIKELGVYSIPIKLHSDIEGIVKLWVVRE